MATKRTNPPTKGGPLREIGRICRKCGRPLVLGEPVTFAPHALGKQLYACAPKCSKPRDEIIASLRRSRPKRDNPGARFGGQEREELAHAKRGKIPAGSGRRQIAGGTRRDPTHPRKKNPATAAQVAGARLTYRKEHWGLGGKDKDRELRVGDPFAGPLVVLGELVSVTYRTTKFGDGESDYTHTFEGPLPVLGHTSEGLLVIGGGGYRMSARGIVK